MQVGKAYAARCSKALNKKDAEALQVEGFERMEAVFAKGKFLLGVEVWLAGDRAIASHFRCVQPVARDVTEVGCLGRPALPSPTLTQISAARFLFCSAGAAAVDELKEVAKSLRKLPVVDPELPTVS